MTLCENGAHNDRHVVEPQCWKNRADVKVTVYLNRDDPERLNVCFDCLSKIVELCGQNGWPYETDPPE